MRRALWYGIAVAVTSAVCARAGTITSSVDTDSVAKGVAFGVVVQITGDDVTDLTIPKIDGATISESPVKSGTQMNAVNGSIRFIQYYVFSVTPNRVGELVIPPFTATANGATIESEAIHVTVVESDHVMFTEIKTDKSDAYQGEPIALTMEVWLIEGARIPGFEPTGFPELTGFYALPRNPSENPRQRMDTRDGRKYKVITFAQTLFPTSSGALRIGPWTWACGVAYHGMARNREIKTEPFTIKVKPLPNPPADFSGSVGTYQTAAALSANSTDVGVPISLTVGIVGDGNPDAIGMPHLPSIDGVYIDEPKRIELPQQQGATNGENFLYKLTPQRAGDIVVPSIGYVYFDPAQAAYQTAQTEPLVIHVRGTAKREDQVIVGAGGAESTTATLGSDISDLAANPGNLRRQTDLTIPTELGYATPVAAYAAFALYLRRRRRFETDRAYARAYGALKCGTERLEHARESGCAADALYQAVTGYIADQFNLPETGMTSVEARSFFQSHSIPAEIADAFHRILKTCERARYAAAELSADEIEALIQGARTGMGRLDDFLKRGRAA